MWLCPFDPPTQTVIVIPTRQANEWENADEWWFGHDWHRAPGIPLGQSGGFDTLKPRFKDSGGRMSATVTLLFSAG